MMACWCTTSCLRLTDPKFVIFEMDAGWVFASGHKPVDYLTKTPERFPLMHVKDMIKQPDGKELMTVLGKGSLDYGPIMHAATGLQVLLCGAGSV